MADNIQFFQWSGINRNGIRLKGVVQSADIKAAELELKNKGIEVISLKPKHRLTFTLRRKKIKPKEIVLFTRYLSTMLTAGLPILQALDIIAHDQENEVMRSVVTSLQSRISAGTSFADSLSQYPESFSELYCNLVRAGEKSGTLDKVSNRLSKYLEKMEAIKRKIKTALIYPVTIVLVALIVSLVLLIFVVPQFQTLFQNSSAQLPYFTQLVIRLSNFIRSYWWIIIIGLFFLGWGLISLKRKNVYFSNWIDAQSLKIFIIGNILQKSIIARFTRTLSITLDSGLPIVESMRSMVNIMGNKVYSKAILKICEDVASGHQLSVAMDATKLFPNMVIQMIAVGEASGAMAAMLNNIADYYEDEVDAIAENLSTLLEPIIIVILGLIIGCFVVAMYLPIFKLGSTI